MVKNKGTGEERRRKWVGGHLYRQSRELREL
jgi:hypothetical protein